MEEQSKQVKAAGFMEERKQRSNSAYVFSVRDRRLVWHFPSLSKTVVFNVDKVSATNRSRFMVFGAKQRVQDGAALDAGADGKVSVQDKYTEMQRLVDHYETGTEEWTLRPQAGTSGPASYVTQALVSLKTFSGAAAAKPGKVDVSDAEKANAFVKQVAENPALKLKGEMGKARAWLEANSKSIREAIVAIRAAEAPAFDADAEIEALKTEETPPQS